MAAALGAAQSGGPESRTGGAGALAPFPEDAPVKDSGLTITEVKWDLVPLPLHPQHHRVPPRTCRLVLRLLCSSPRTKRGWEESEGAAVAGT